MFLIGFITGAWLDWDWDWDFTLCPQTFVSKTLVVESNRDLSAGLTTFPPTSDLLIYLNVYLCFYRIGARIAACCDALYPRPRAQAFGWLGLMTDNEEVGSGVKVGARALPTRR